MVCLNTTEWFMVCLNATEAWVVYGVSEYN